MYPSVYPIIMFMYPWILYFCLHFRKVSFWTPVILSLLYLMVEFLCIHIIMMVNVSMVPQSGSRYTLLVPGYIFVIKTFEICFMYPLMYPSGSMDPSKWFHGYYPCDSMDPFSVLSINVSYYHVHVSMDPVFLSTFQKGFILDSSNFIFIVFNGGISVYTHHHDGKCIHGSTKWFQVYIAGSWVHFCNKNI